MAETINLRLARKRKRRSDKEKAAAKSRLKSGRSGAENELTRRARALQEKRLAGHYRERPQGDGDDGA